MNGRAQARTFERIISPATLQRPVDECKISFFSEGS
jgi:hypothetical protein